MWRRHRCVGNEPGAVTRYHSLGPHQDLWRRPHVASSGTGALHVASTENNRWQSSTSSVHLGTAAAPRAGLGHLCRATPAGQHVEGVLKRQRGACGERKGPRAWYAPAGAKPPAASRFGAFAVRRTIGKGEMVHAVCAAAAAARVLRRAVGLADRHLTDVQ